jgi:multicomponent Na+:H+ antiporter subunit G
MIDILMGLLLLTGGFFCLVAAVGVIRLPDLFIRMHAATKAGSLGAGLLVLAAALFFQEPGISLRAGTIVLLLFFTAPVAAHLVARVAHRRGEPLWDRTWIDELGQAGAGTETETETEDSLSGREEP